MTTDVTTIAHFHPTTTIDARIDALTARVTALETPPVPVPVVVPPTILTVGAGKVGVDVTTDNVTIDGYAIFGPQSAAFVQNEVGIRAVGTLAAPIRNLTIRNCRIAKFGYGGILVDHVLNLLIEDCIIDDSVYAGIMAISVTGIIRRNTIHRVGYGVAPANLPGSGNAYGIAVTSQSGVVTDQSHDVLVQANIIEDVPSWHGLDTHGGQRVTFDTNTVRRCARAAFLTTQGPVRPAALVFKGNLLELPATVTGGTNAVPLTLVSVDGITISGNTIRGWAGQSPSASAPYYDYGASSTGIVVGLGNVVQP